MKAKLPLTKVKLLLTQLKNWVSDYFGNFTKITEWEESIILSYKGSTTVDAAAFYCPHIPLITTSAVSVTNQISFTTRYGIFK